jgi:TM2 domain-containing membrane protein YozV
MAKIVSIKDDVIGIGMDDGRLISVDRENVNFFPSIGDFVEVFENTDDIVVAKADQNRFGIPKTANPNGRSKLAAGLLGIFLGGFGIHSFYLGKASIGIIQIVVTLVTCGLGSVWGLIEGIVILCSKPGTSYHQDSDGNELDD